MKMLEVLVYQEPTGKRPFEAWLDGLESAAAAKVADTVRRMAAGNLSDAKSVGAGVMERRIHWGPGYRVYFGRDGDRIIVCSVAAQKSGKNEISRTHKAAGRITSGDVEMEEVRMGKAVTVPFSEIVERRTRRDPVFAVALLEEAMRAFLSGETALARAHVRDVIKGSIGYAELSRRTGTPETSLIRMFGPSGNPTAENLSTVFVHLQRAGGVELQVTSVPAQRKRAIKHSRAVASRSGRSTRPTGSGPHQRRQAV